METDLDFLETTLGFSPLYLFGAPKHNFTRVLMGECKEIQGSNRLRPLFVYIEETWASGGNGAELTSVQLIFQKP